MNSTRNIKKIALYQIGMLLVFLCIFTYTKNDLATGVTTYNFSEVSRSASHLWLAITIAVTASYSLLLPRLHFNNPYSTVLIATSIWTVISCLIWGISLWTTVTYTGFVLWWLFSFNLFSEYCIKYSDGKKNVDFFCLLILLYYTYKFITTYTYANTVASSQYAVLNIVFRVIVFIPLLLISNNNVIKKAAISAICLMTLFSMKRAAIIAVPVMLLSYTFVNAKIKNKSIKWIVGAFVVVIVTIIVLPEVDSFFGGFLSQRFSKDSIEFASGRTARWTNTLKTINEGGFLRLLVGSGIGSMGYAQHNEWLEQLSSFGLIGVCLYFALAIQMIRVFRYYYRIKSTLAAPYLAAIIYFFIVGFVSGFLYMHSTLYIVVFMGIAQSIEPWRNSRKAVSNV